jgi:hypothetical protein
LKTALHTFVALLDGLYTAAGTAPLRTVGLNGKNPPKKNSQSSISCNSFTNFENDVYEINGNGNQVNR